MQMHLSSGSTFDLLCVKFKRHILIHSLVSTYEPTAKSRRLSDHINIEHLFFGSVFKFFVRLGHNNVIMLSHAYNQRLVSIRVMTTEKKLACYGMRWVFYYVWRISKQFLKILQKVSHQPNFLTPLAQSFGLFGLWCTTATICKLKHPLGVWAL